MAHRELRKSRVLVAAAGLFFALLCLWVRIAWLQIALHDHGPSSCRAHVSRGRLGLVTRPVVDNGNIGARASEIDRDCGADALDACDENAAPGQLHEVSCRALLIDRAFDDEAEGERRACRRWDAHDDDLVPEIVGRC